MRVAAASEPGSPDKPNEDGVVITADMAAVLDGATVRTDTGCVHSVPWFVENLARSLVSHQEMSPADALTAAITETTAAHRDTCDLNHPGTPSAALAIVQVYADSLRYLVLGDVTLAIETTDDVRIITDNRVDRTATAERAAADVLPAGTLQKAEALARMKHAELPLPAIRRAILLTDGAARAVIQFKICDWPSIFSVVTAEGPSALIKQVRMAEDADPAGNLHPRNKIHDDATVASITF